MTGHNFEGILQAALGGVVTLAIYLLIKHELAEYRARQIKRARAKFRRRP